MRHVQKLGPNGVRERAYLLSAREYELVWCVGQGMSNKQITARTGLTEGTVKVYLSGIYRELGLDLAAGAGIEAITGRRALMLWAQRNQIAAPQKPWKTRQSRGPTYELPHAGLPQAA